MKNFMFLMLLPLGCMAQGNRNLPVRVDTLAGGMYRIMIGHGGAVIALAGEEGTLLVDDCTRDAAPVLQEELAELRCPGIRYIINTHFHRDHTGGNALLGKGTVIIAHDNVKKWLEQPQLSPGGDAQPFPVTALPGITFSDRLTLTFNGSTVEVIHLKDGHTDGDAIVWFPAQKVIHVGDLLFADAFPFVDTEHGGNPVRYVENVKWIASVFPSDTRVVGGHGRMLTMDEYAAYGDTLAVTLDKVREAKRSGMSQEDMKSHRILQQWTSFGEDWITEDRWIDTVYDYL